MYKFLILVPILRPRSQTGESGERQQLVLHASCVHMLFDVNICSCFSEVGQRYTFTYITIALLYSELYSNYGGISVFQLIKDDAKIMIEDVISKNNEYRGMYLTGTGITVNNANIKNSGDAGLLIGSNAENNEITLAGDITSTNNKFGFAASSFAEGAVHVTGNLISNHNVYGVATYAPALTIAVGGSYSGKSGKSGSGSLTACDNSLYDIDNAGGSLPWSGGPSTFKGSDYTCVTTDGADLPQCKPCSPDCSSSDHSDDGSSHSLGLGLGDFVAGEDLDFPDMGHREFPF